MPQKAIVLSVNAGRSEWGVPVHTSSVQARCYGATPYEADEVWRALHSVSHRVNNAVVTVGGTDYCIYVLELASGPIEQFEPETEWPFSLSNWTLQVSEMALP